MLPRQVDLYLVALRRCTLDFRRERPAQIADYAVAVLSCHFRPRRIESLALVLLNRRAHLICYQPIPDPAMADREQPGLLPRCQTM